MEKKESRRPSVVCEKISKAVSRYPAFRFARRILNRHQEPNPATPATQPSQLLTPSVKTIDIQSNRDASKPPKLAPAPRFPKLKETAEMIPVNYASSAKLQPAEAALKRTSSPVPPIPKNTPPVAKAPPKIEPEPARRTINPGQQTKVQTSNADDAGGKKAGASNDDRFMEYITRVKNKIGRSVSNIGDGTKIGRSTSANVGDKSTSQNQKDKFAEFIDRAKLKMRSMSTVGPGK